MSTLKVILVQLLFNLVLLLVTSYVSYTHGWDKGNAEALIQVNAARTASKALEEKVAKATIKLQESQTEFEKKLNETDETYKKSISAINAANAKRLLDSKKRNIIYRDKAGSSPAGCQYVANHAGRLDESLEEGRSLVEEFSATIRQRDEQVNLLGQEILTYRNTIEGKE